MEGGVAEVLFALLQSAADALLLGDVTVKFFDVSFGLIGTLVLDFGAVALGLFGLRRGSLNIVNVPGVREINEGDERGRGDDGIQTDLVNQLDEDAGRHRARDVCDGRRKIMFVPSSPDSGVGFAGGV